MLIIPEQFYFEVEHHLYNPDTLRLLKEYPNAQPEEQREIQEQVLQGAVLFGRFQDRKSVRFHCLFLKHIIYLIYATMTVD